MGLNGGRRFFRPYERAIVLVVVFPIVMFDTSPFDGYGTALSSLLYIVFVAAIGGVAGLSSAFSTLWRVLAGLLVVLPLDYYAFSVLLNQSDAWAPKVLPLALEPVVCAILTWMLPYLDPPAFAQRWIAHAPSRSTATLRKGCVYIGYVGWLLVVCVAILLVLAVITGIAGWETNFSEALPVEVRTVLAGLLAVVSVLALSGWFLVRLWRGRKTVKPFPDTLREPSAPLPDFVADAVRDSAGKPV